MGQGSHGDSAEPLPGSGTAPRNAPGTGDVVAPQPPRGARRWLRIGFAVMAVALLGWAVVEQREAFAEAITTIPPVTLVLALAAVLVGLLANMASWRAAMSAVGVGLPLALATRVFFLSQLGKYVPGSVWPVVAQMELTRDRGVSRLRGATGAVVAMIVGVITSGAAALALLVLPDAAIRSRYWWLLIAVPAAAVVIHPRVMAFALRIALRVLRRPGPVPELSGRALVRSATWSVAMWAAFGLHAWLIARELAPDVPVGYLEVSGAFALAWVVGFVFVLAPAGLGAREAALALALAGTLAGGQAVVLAVMSRVVMTAADALAAGAAVLLTRHRDPGSRPRSRRSNPARPR